MLNRPANWLSETNQHSGWDSDRAPGVRLIVLWLAVLISLLVVIARMAQLQILLRDDFAGGFEKTWDVEEHMPARDGRILAADGSVLASDEERYDLQVHYRRIEEPADPNWLRVEAMKNLSSVERKNKLAVATEKERVLRRRDELWLLISRLTKRDSQEMAAGRTSVQQRVATIREAVLRKRVQRLEKQNDAAIKPSMISATGWQAIWSLIRKELTEPPTRAAESGPLLEERDYHTVVSDVDADVKAEIEAHPERYPGVRIFVRSRRVYPMGEVASHLVGSRTSLSDDEIAARNERDSAGFNQYCKGDTTGRSGLELKYESHLHGVAGTRILTKNRRGEIIRTSIQREPRHGRDLVLTVDVDVQRKAEQLLDEALANVTLASAVDDEAHQSSTSQPTCPQGGCLVAIDVHSGAILAAASAPRFDLNLLTNSDRQRWNDLVEDPRKPLFPRATQMALAPGSVFKTLSAIAAVESGKVHPDVPIHCRGYLDRPDQYRCLVYRHHGFEHGDMRLADALCKSCNVYFFTAARRMGPLPIVEWAERFGIGCPTGIDLPSEGSGHLPSPKELVDGNPRRWHPGDTLGLAIGQADLLVTPVQMVRAMAAVANDGLLVTPHLAGDAGPVQVDKSPLFRPVISHPEPQPIAGLNRETLAHVREGLDMVVNHPTGTAYKSVHLKEIRVAGKTGTAETNGADHAWFAGYVPADHPRIAFVVVLEHGGSGGRAAGPVAKKFVKCLLELGLVVRPSNLARE